MQSAGSCLTASACVGARGGSACVGTVAGTVQAGGRALLPWLDPIIKAMHSIVQALYSGRNLEMASLGFSFVRQLFSMPPPLLGHPEESEFLPCASMLCILLLFSLTNSAPFPDLFS